MVEELIGWTTFVLEMVGIGVIALGALWATLASAARWLRRPPASGIYRRYRRDLSRGILLGLEFLVAADIIDTVAVEPNFRSVGVLGLIVLIRTFLSFALEVEIGGRWPWQAPRPPEPAKG